jgi:tetratricopeptide (TPR) repeat protein
MVTLPHNRENAVEAQLGYELLMSDDPPKPRRYDIAAYIRTEAINHQGKHKEAAEILHALIESQGALLPPPELANWQYALGVYLFEDGQYERAISHLRVGERTINGRHRNESLPLLVLSLVRLNRLEEAGTAFERLCKQYPDSKFFTKAAEELSLREMSAAR